jgi:hypothetical protein
MRPAEDAIGHTGVTQYAERAQRRDKIGISGLEPEYTPDGPHENARGSSSRGRSAFYFIRRQTPEWMLV